MKTELTQAAKFKKLAKNKMNEKQILKEDSEIFRKHIQYIADGMYSDFCKKIEVQINSYDRRYNTTILLTEYTIETTDNIKEYLATATGHDNMFTLMPELCLSGLEKWDILEQALIQNFKKNGFYVRSYTYSGIRTKIRIYWSFWEWFTGL